MKEAWNAILYSSKNEEITLPRVYLCVYPVFQWGNTVKKCGKNVGVWKKIKNRDGYNSRLSIGEGFQIFYILWWGSCHCQTKRKTYTLSEELKIVNKNVDLGCYKY